VFVCAGRGASCKAFLPVNASRAALCAIRPSREGSSVFLRLCPRGWRLLMRHWKPHVLVKPSVISVPRLIDTALLKARSIVLTHFFGSVPWS